MQPQGIKIRDILTIESSCITLLARFRGDEHRYGIVYMPPGTTKPVQVFPSTFASLFHTLVSDFEIGFTTGAIVGLARERNPADAWRSDTIERSIQDKNSIYRGILRIVNEEDGIPVFMQATKAIGNIAPALAYFHRGNSLEIQQTLDRYNGIQKSIVSKVQERKPRMTGNDTLIGSRLGNDGFKLDNRASAINRALGGVSSTTQY